MGSDAGSWVPESCTLPTVARPVRVAEFDRLFAADVRAVERTADAGVRLVLAPEPGAAARAAELAVRETRCCGFFTFTLTATDGRLALTVTAPESHRAVLDALADRAMAGRG